MVATPRRGRPAPDEPTPGGVGRFLVEHRAGALACAVVAVAVLAGWALWSRVGDSTLVHADAVLRPEAVEVVGIAPWVKCDLKTEALRNASLDGGLPLGDPELARRLARAFGMHPWVKIVTHVSVEHPAAARVRVECREPVAMIGVKGGLLAVDADGVVLPSGDFTAESAAAYPRISGVESSPQGPEGSPWGDPVVEEAAAVAVAVGPEWKPLGLVECRPVGRQGLRRWELVGPGPRMIVFGSAPGRETAGEPTAAAKLARLKSLAAGPPAADPARVDLTVDAPPDSAGPKPVPAPP